MVQFRQQIFLILFAFLPLLGWSQCPSVPEICNNGIDDDCDGLIDCYDGDCSSNANCANFYFGRDSGTCQVAPPVVTGYNLVEVWRNTDWIETRSTPIVGDLDNDGIPEVLAHYRDNNTVYILNGVDGSKKATINAHLSDYSQSPALADVDGDGFSEIFMVDQTGKLLCFDHNGVAKAGFTPIIINKGIGSSANIFAANPSFADFNGDGTPEIFIGNQVFNAITGAVIAELSNPNGSSKGAVGSGHIFSAAFDILPDNFCADCSGIELICGNVVYSVNVATGIMTEVSKAPSSVNDGKVSLADWNGDKQMDVIVSTACCGNGGSIYIWDPRTQAFITTDAQGNTIPNNPADVQPTQSTQVGVASIADFDGDGFLELGMAGRDEFVVMESDLTRKWAIPVIDGSNQTTSTAFDFEGDGKTEIVYRDERNLYILDGATGEVITKTKCGSATRTDLPVVVDVNGDGDAELLCTCADTDGTGRGHVRVYESDSTVWVPTRNLWNTHNYVPSFINDDLTVPRQFQNKSLIPGQDLYLSQTSLTYPSGNPVYPSLPDYTIVLDSIGKSCDAKTAKAHIKICQTTENALVFDFDVSFYKGDPKSGGTLLGTERVDHSASTIPATGCMTMEYDLEWGAYDLHIYVNDKGTDLANPPTILMPECDITNNTVNTTLTECNCVDTDKDGVCDKDDLDDDNDGILDKNECPTSNFYWSDPPTINGKIATGTINGNGYTYTCSVNIETSPGPYSHGTFPAEYKVPNTKVIKNKSVSTNTITFDQPIENPSLLFSSIGNGNKNVPIEFSNPVEMIFQNGNVTIDSPTKLSGREGYIIVRMNGTFESISFNYLASEYYVNFTFGVDEITYCDTDNDGTPDYLDTDSDDDGCLDAQEGGANFKLSDTENGELKGGVDAKGIPLVAGAAGQSAGTSTDASQLDASCKKELIQPDTLYICKSDTVEIKSNGIKDGSWFGEEAYTQVHDSLIKVSPPTSSWYGVGKKAGITKGENLIVNGDFESGSTGFTSGYDEDCFTRPFMKQGGYCIGTNPNVYNRYWSNCGDHTNGTGNMFITDASTVAGVKVWCQTIAVNSATDYEFSSWIQSVMSPNPAVLEFEINGSLLGSTLNAVSTTCQWQNYAAKWNSAAATSANICLVNKNTNGGGNDFALDDIYFGKITEALSDESDSVFVVVRELPSVELGNDTSICVDSTLVLDAGNEKSDFKWNGGETTQSITVKETGKYFVDIIDTNSCVAVDTINVRVKKCIESLCGSGIDFNDWNQQGLKKDGDWVVSTDGSSVNQTINGDPTFYMGDKDYLNVKFSGKMRTDFSGDDDWMGMVFGYQGGELTDNYPVTIKTYVFSWKQKHQSQGVWEWPEGFSLIEVNTTINSSNDFRNAFGPPYTGSTVLDTLHGAGRGYKTSQDYNLAIEYTGSNIKVFVNGDTIFNVNGCFDPGKIGFYNWSQPDVTYSDFSYQFIGNIDMEDDSICVSDEMNVAVYEGPKCNSGNYYPVGANFSWDLTDGTKSSENQVKHTYDKAGSYDVQLIVSDETGCADTTFKTIYIADYPVVNLGKDTAVCIGDSVVLDTKLTSISHLWNVGSTDSTVTVKTTGEYSVAVSNWGPCLTEKAIKITVNELPVVSVGNDTTICDKDTISLDVSKNKVSYLWNNLEETGSIKIFEKGEYGVVLVDSNGCAGSDSMLLDIQPLPDLKVSNDTLICDEDTITINATHNGTKVLWSTGDNVENIKVHKESKYYVEVNDDLGCLSKDSVEVLIRILPQFKLHNDTSICEGDSIQLEGVTGFSSYLWNTGASLEKIFVKTQEQFKLEIQDELGCANLDSMELTVLPQPDVTLANDTTVCIGESVSIDAQNELFVHSWNTGSTEQIITVSTTDNYVVAVADATGQCTDTDSMKVTIQPLPIVDLGLDTVLCEQASLLLDAKNNNMKHSWNSGARGSTLLIDAAGTYSVTVVDEYDCESSDEIKIKYDSIPDLFPEKEFEICQGDTQALFPINYVDSLNVSWLELSSAEDTLFALSQGAYTSKVNSAYCFKTFEVKLTVLDTPQIELFNVRGHEKYCFQYEFPPIAVTGMDAGIVSNLWLPDSVAGDTLKAKRAGFYTVISSNEKCSSKNLIKIDEFCPAQVYIPNAFSPNGDGENDYFYPHMINTENYELYIYNRWGEIVFKSTTPEDAWDGYGKYGSKCQLGVYVYKLYYAIPTTFGGLENKSQIGTVTLVR